MGKTYLSVIVLYYYPFTYVCIFLIVNKYYFSEHILHF